MPPRLVATLLLGACVPRQFAPLDAGAAPEYVASFSTGSQDASASRVPPGASVEIVEPSPCDATCAGLVKRLGAALESEGYPIAAGDSQVRLVFDRLRVEPEAPVAPTGLDVFTLGPDGVRSPLAVPAAVAEACRAVAAEAGTSSGPYVDVAVRAVDSATNDVLLTWSYEAGLPVRTELVYQPRISGDGALPAHPTPAFNGTQTLGAALLITGGGATGAGGALWYGLGRGWSQESAIMGDMAMVGIPTLLTGLVVMAVGNHRARSSPAPLPEGIDLAWAPPESVLCQVPPARREEIRPETTPPPVVAESAVAPEVPEMSASFSLRAAAPVRAAPDDPTAPLVEGAISDLVRSMEAP